MIKLSKKWDYWLKAILYIASNCWVLKISNISKDLNISETFLRKIISDFQKKWLLKTIKWRNGWVYIEKNLKEISLFDIFSSLWEDLYITSCTEWKYCNNQDICWTSWVLQSLQKWFTTLLKIHTLDKITKKNNSF